MGKEKNDKKKIKRQQMREDDKSKRWKCERKRKEGQGIKSAIFGKQ